MNATEICEGQEWVRPSNRSDRIHVTAVTDVKFHGLTEEGYPVEAALGWLTLNYELEP